MADKYIMGLVGKGKTTVAGASTILQIWGLYHLVGFTVSAFVNSADCGDYVVAADGSIDVPLWPTVANNGMKLANLLAADGSLGESDCPVSLTSASVESFITIQVVVGVAYVAQGQLLRPATEADVKSEIGAALGKKRRAYEVGVLVRESRNFQLGTSLTPAGLGNMDYTFLSEIEEGADADYDLTYSETFSGVHWATLRDSSSYDGMVCWQMDRPLPLTICAISTFLETGER